MSPVIFGHLADWASLTLASGSSASHAVAMREPPLPGWEQMADTILFGLVDLSIVLLALAFAMCLWRLIKGPTLVDRGLASDTISVQVVAFVILLTIRLKTLVFFDAVLIVAVLGFASTVAFAQFIGRRRAV